MMKTTLRITSVNVRNKLRDLDPCKAAVIEKMSALGGLSSEEATLGLTALMAGDAFTFESTYDADTLQQLVRLGVEVINQETHTYVMAAHDLAIRAIGCCQYSKARSALKALMDIDPDAR